MKDKHHFIYYNLGTHFVNMTIDIVLDCCQNILDSLYNILLLEIVSKTTI